jgi:hypothetical protein
MKPITLKRAAVQKNSKDSLAEEILNLHSEILSAAHVSLEKAIRIGELLTEVKAKLKHGEWLPWIETNLAFGRATAANYMRVWERRGEIANVKANLHLTTALRLLSPPSETPPPRKVSEIQPFATAHTYTNNDWFILFALVRFGHALSHEDKEIFAMTLFVKLKLGHQLSEEELAEFAEKLPRKEECQNAMDEWLAQQEETAAVEAK